MQDKIILDLCGGTGSWSKPYADAGYDVRVITLPDYDVTRTIIDKTVPAVVFHGEAGTMRIPVANIYGILAAPPCTQFSIARTNAKTPPDFAGAMEIVSACLRVVWHCRSAGSLKFWALENPTGHLRKFLGHPPMWFYQWEFGTEFYKRTDIWGYYNAPKRLVKVRPAGHSRIASSKSWTNPKIPENLKHLNATDARAAIRAITPPGFARAFMDANK